MTRNEVNRIGGGANVAAGAVAVIIESPSDARHANKIRFKDGIEAMVRRSEFQSEADGPWCGYTRNALGIAEVHEKVM